MIKAVIFDLDDTLCNSTVIIEDILKSIFTKHLKYFPGKSVESSNNLFLPGNDSWIFSFNSILSEPEFHQITSFLYTYLYFNPIIYKVKYQFNRVVGLL